MTGPGPSDPQTPSGGSPGGGWASQGQQWKPATVSAGPAPGIVYAELGPRLGAYIIDVIIVAIAVSIINAVVIGILFAGGGTSSALVVAFVILAVLNLAASAVYFVYTWTSMRASPGQRILGLMTVNETDGATLTMNQAITRYLVMFAPGLVGGVASSALGGILGLILSLLGFAWSIYLLYTTANDAKRQGFHDKYAHTVVVKAAAATA